MMPLSRLIGLLALANSHSSRASSTTMHSSRLLSGGATSDSDLSFTKLAERVAWEGRYRRVKTSDWKLPNGKNVSYDVLTQAKDGKGSVTVFCFHRRDRTATLVREFHPGAEALQLGTINGMFEADKHATPLQCAQMELEEEAQLRCSNDENWIPLYDTSTRGVCMDKYSDNFVRPFLALDAEQVLDARPPDDTEFIQVVSGLTYDEVMRQVRCGGINVASSHCVLLAYRKLDDLGIPYR